MITDSLPFDTITALGSYDSPTISNAIEAFLVQDNIVGYASRELRCQFPDLEPMVGYAVTCTMDSTSPAPKPPNKLAEFLDVIYAAPKPSVVVIQDVGPDPLKSCFSGDLISTVYQSLGVVGLVQNGGFRDYSGIRHHAPGFQIFAPGMVVSHGNASIIDINVTVSVASMEINPGDILHGDESGLLTIPKTIARSVADQAYKVRAEEERVFSNIKESMPLDDLKQLILGADIARTDT